MIIPFRSLLASLTATLITCACSVSDTGLQEGRATTELQESKEKTMLIQFLEIVTPDAEATCNAIEKLHGVSFSAPDASLGNARTAALEAGGRISVRAPMRESEDPVVRPYVLVDDIESAVEAARTAGAEIAMPATEIPSQGKFAIYILGGIQHGLWQL